jgi:hypothetical protein
MNDIKIRNNFELALNNFDFLRTYQVMDALDWTWWWDSGGKIPSQEKQIQEVKAIFERALNECSKTETNRMELGTGGFYVVIYTKSNKVEIKFVIEESYSCDYDDAETE